MQPCSYGPIMSRGWCGDGTLSGSGLRVLQRCSVKTNATPRRKRLDAMTEAELQSKSVPLFVLRHLFRDAPPWEVDELLRHMARGGRAATGLNRRSFARRYRRPVAGPSCNWHAAAAKLNASPEKGGAPKMATGPEPQASKILHHYLKETLRQKEYRELADNSAGADLPTTLVTKYLRIGPSESKLKLGSQAGHQK